MAIYRNLQDTQVIRGQILFSCWYQLLVSRNFSCQSLKRVCRYRAHPIARHRRFPRFFFRNQLARTLFDPQFTHFTHYQSLPSYNSADIRTRRETSSTQSSSLVPSPRLQRSPDETCRPCESDRASQSSGKSEHDILLRLFLAQSLLVTNVGSKRDHGIQRTPTAYSWRRERLGA
jgi:hypothetical protein